MQANGAVIFRGVSRLDNKTPIVVIATGLAAGSSNRKTGAMVQTYILRADMSPLEAIATYADGPICGGCKHRGRMVDGKRHGRTCYVNIGQGPTGVYKAWKRGRYTPARTFEEIANVGRGRIVRLGTYGDPAAVPYAIWEALLSASTAHTGYTHQWRAPKFGKLAEIIQASCETAQDVTNANAKGFGTFRVLPVFSDVPEKTIHCPSAASNGAVQCADCLMCDGSGKNIAIHAHGPAQRMYNAL